MNSHNNQLPGGSIAQLVEKKSDFINRVDNVNWPPYRDSKS